MTANTITATPAPQIQPNQSLYISNLNTKMKKNELKRLLYALFSAHGQILEIVAMKTEKLRGQAFVVYKELGSAVVAMRALQGYPLFDQSMRIQYAKSKSNAVKEMEIIMSGGTIQYKKSVNGVESENQQGSEFNEEEEEQEDAE